MYEEGYFGEKDKILWGLLGNADGEEEPLIVMWEILCQVDLI